MEANDIFIELAAPVIDGLFADGFQFYRWGDDDGANGGTTVRLVTAFDTRESDVMAPIAAARGHAESVRP